MASTETPAEQATDFSSKKRATIALIVAIVATAAMIVTAKVVQDKQAQSPVQLSNVPLPDNESVKCAELMQRLPERVDGLVKAQLADPAPAGAAVWRDIHDDRVTLRCGTNIPDQYNEMAVTEGINAVKWLTVNDVSDPELTTWFAVGRNPTVAVTANKSHKDALSDLSKALGKDSDNGPAPKAAPLVVASLPAPLHDATCKGLDAALPRELAEYKRLENTDFPETVSKSVAKGGDGFTAWTNEYGDAITLRCGVEEPKGYRTTTEQLTQVGDIVWFKEPSLSSGDNGTWYAMGRERFVAVNLPMSLGSSVLPVLSDAIANNLKNTAPSES